MPTGTPIEKQDGHLTGQERVTLYEERMAALRERAFASPIGNPGWCIDFDRYAQELRKTPFPAEFGFSVAAFRKDVA